LQISAFGSLIGEPPDYSQQGFQAGSLGDSAWNIFPQNMTEHRKKTTAIAAAAALIFFGALWLTVPTVTISPDTGQSSIQLGQPVVIDSSPLASIGKVAVYADDKMVAAEYNLGTGDLERDFDLKPGQNVRVEAKVASVIGVTREFSSTFTTVEPVIVDSLSVNGERLKPGQKIPPQSTLVFSFNKPLTQAAVSLDGGEAIEMQIDPEHPEVATLQPLVSFKQGATVLLKLMATATDSATLESKELRTGIVKPLSLYGKVETADGQTRIELDASTPFTDPEAVRSALETTLPDPVISVERQKIVITCSSLDLSSEYSIKLARADGADGSFLEAPLSMTVSFKADPSQAAASGGSSYRGYVYTESSSSSSGGGSTDSGPPPGWPPCCPWPPQ